MRFFAQLNALTILVTLYNQHISICAEFSFLFTLVWKQWIENCILSDFIQYIERKYLSISVILLVFHERS